jgi:hypothetical protein
LKTVDYNITHTNIITALNSTTSSLLTISNFNSTFNSLINTTLNTYLRTSVFNTTNQSNINNLNTLNSMIYSDAGDVSINCNNNVNFKAVVNSQLRIPLSVRPVAYSCRILLLLHRVLSKAPQVEEVEH